jgi:hypothetical protein
MMTGETNSVSSSSLDEFLVHQDICSLAPPRDRDGKRILHEHVPHVVVADPSTGWILMGCTRCGKVASVRPNRRLRNLPWGFRSRELWDAYLDRFAPKKAA